MPRLDPDLLPVASDLPSVPNAEATDQVALYRNGVMTLLPYTALSAGGAGNDTIDGGDAFADVVDTIYDGGGA